MAGESGDSRDVIEFGGRKELDPNAEEAYRQKIAEARKGVDSLKGTQPLGGIPRPQMPVLSRDRVAAPSPSPMTPDGGVQPRPPGSPAIRPETQQQLEDMAKAQEAAAQATLDEKKVVEDAKKEKGLSDDDLFDMMDFNQRNEAERILNNKKRRKEIEGRCEPMNFEDLLISNEVAQTVPIIPGKFEPRYRSLTPEESLFIKKLMSREQTVNDQYMLEKYGLLQLTCSITSINGVPLPDHRGKDGTPDDDLFQTKLKVITKKSGYIVADLGINYAWFDLRVRRLINPDDLKNG